MDKQVKAPRSNPNMVRVVIPLSDNTRRGAYVYDVSSDEALSGFGLLIARCRLEREGCPMSDIDYGKIRPSSISEKELSRLKGLPKTKIDKIKRSVRRCNDLDCSGATKKDACKFKRDLCAAVKKSDGECCIELMAGWCDVSDESPEFRVIEVTPHATWKGFGALEDNYELEDDYEGDTEANVGETLFQF